MQNNNFQEIAQKQEDDIGAYMYVRGTYNKGVITTSFGVYPATLSPKGIMSLQDKQVDLSKPVTMMIVPVTKPEVSEYNLAGKQKPYLGFIIEQVDPATSPETFVGNKVVIQGKVINEKRKYEFVLIKVYYPFMLSRYSVIKLNGVLEGYGDAVDSDYYIEAEVVDNEIVIKNSRRLNDTAIEVREFLPVSRRRRIVQ